MGPIFSLDHHARSPVQLNKDHSAGSSQRQTNTRSTYAQKRNHYLCILLENQRGNFQLKTNFHQQEIGRLGEEYLER